jgi:predicted PurR-regulated permease PerM
MSSKLDRIEVASRTEGPGRWALGVMAILAILVLLTVALPVFAGLLLGTLCAFSFYPLHRRLSTRIGATWSAATCASLVTLALATGLTATVYLVYTQGTAITKALPQELSTGGGLAEIVASAVKPLEPFGVHPEDATRHLANAASGLEEHAAGWAASAFSGAMHLLLAMAFMGLTCFFVLQRWGRMQHLVESLSPLEPHQTHELVVEARSLGKEVMLGTVIVGLVQGLLAGVGFAIFGVSHAALFGSLTAIASAIPGLGTLFIWVPAGVYLLATGHMGTGVGELVWGAFVVVMACDGILRPRLVGRGGSGMGFLATLIGLFGGIELFGFLGLLLGPLLVGMSLSALRLYGRERRTTSRGAGRQLDDGVDELS